VNAIARPLRGGDELDPFGGHADLHAKLLRAVCPTAFEDDPLRLLRAVRFEQELGFRMEDETERLVRQHAPLVTRPAGERILDELVRLDAGSFRRMDDLGLLDPLGGALDRLARLPGEPSNNLLLVTILGESLERLPISRELARYARTLLHAEPPADLDARSIHRFRRATEPWALDAVEFLGGDDALARAVAAARTKDPEEPLVRGDELGLPPGPHIGRILERIEEERAAGTIATREEAIDLARREAQ
jgi:tRNA nucleotidyltransferase/poly(A) polymerase